MSTQYLVSGTEEIMNWVTAILCRKAFTASILLLPMPSTILMGADLPPYPASTVIERIEFDFTSSRRAAEGSDNWPVTWADDGHLYTAWGDGGGFGGSNRDGRVKLGVARIEGTPADLKATNVWGGWQAENPSQFDGKSYGIICVKGILYMWVPTQQARHTQSCSIAWSSDHGATWSLAEWSFTYSDKLTVPTFLNFGQNYTGARDEFVYSYLIEPTWGPGSLPQSSHGFDVHRPGRVHLARVPKNALLDRDQYAFFSGLHGDGQPVWSPDVEKKHPVFEDANGTGWNVSVFYNPGLERYILSTEHSESHTGYLGIFDAPEPWGPWSTVVYASNWGHGHIEESTFYWNFNQKWLSRDGTLFVMVFTGKNSNDSWNTISGRFVPRQRHQDIPPPK